MKGLAFSEPMMRAWLNGTKTVTRRMLKFNIAGRVQCGEKQWHIEDPNAYLAARYRPGETVYIKETWRCDDPATAQDIFTPREGVFYKAGMEEWELAVMPKDWKSPRFMPEWASRSHARIVSVRPERVQEITEGEAILEGFMYAGHGDDWQRHDSFRATWATLHPGSWERNDWVWRIALADINS